MKKQLSQVKEFHVVFKQFFEDEPKVNVPKSIKQWRLRLMQEELDEVKQAMGAGNLADIAKELADELYVLLGTVLTYGLGEKFEAIFDEVHRSNMSKLDKSGKPVFRDDGKILKSDQYLPADIDSILK